MNNSALSDHKFKKGKFITPWNEFAKEIGKNDSWYYGRLPEYIWLALILDYYGRNNGMAKCYSIIKKLHTLAPNLSIPKLSKILELSQDIQNEFYKYILDTIDDCVLSPLTIIFTYSNFDSFAANFCLPQFTIEERILRLSTMLKKASDHQSCFSTDVRFIVLYFELLSGKVKLPEETLNLILDYPNLSHDDVKMRIIRPTVRSTEMALNGMEENNDNYINIFWESVSRMSDCELFYIRIEEDIPDTKECLDRTKNILEYYSELLVSAKPIDSKMLVLLGIATYSYKRLLELVEHRLYNTISGRSIIRVLIENYIMMKYLLKNEPAHDDIWSEYQYYGIGQYKLIFERFREIGKTFPNSHVSYDYLNILVNEYKNKEFIDMDTSYFDKQNVREKANSVGEKELFGLYYDYDSAFEHGLWGAIRESSLLKCNSPSHQYHCIPDIDNKQKLKNVWHDCSNIMNKTLLTLKDVYGLPAHLMIGDE